MRMSEGVNPKLEFNCSVCKKPSIFEIKEKLAILEALTEPP